MATTLTPAQAQAVLGGHGDEDAVIITKPKPKPPLTPPEIPSAGPGRQAGKDGYTLDQLRVIGEGGSGGNNNQNNNNNNNDDPPEFHLPGGPPGDGGGGGGGGFDPQMQYKMELYSMYFQLWGKNPPPSVIDMAVSNGWNVYEFEDWIRNQPAFRKSETYQNEYADALLATAQALGILPG